MQDTSQQLDAEVKFYGWTYNFASYPKAKKPTLLGKGLNITQNYAAIQRVIGFPFYT